MTQPGARGHGGEGGERPNVLVILCDQLRRDLLGAYGGTLVRTPHLDALAADAMVFDRANTPAGICSPARASLMTGLYPHAHRMFNNSTPRYSYCQHLRPDATTLAAVEDELAMQAMRIGRSSR
jgi:arylsulfatase A-like enzyme